MKITQSDYNALKAHVAPHVTEQNQTLYRDNGLSDKRFRWDCLWAAKIIIGDGVGINGDLDLYAYLDDRHIDTALRHIVSEILS